MRLQVDSLGACTPDAARQSRSSPIRQASSPPSAMCYHELQSPGCPLCRRVRLGGLHPSSTPVLSTGPSHPADHYSQAGLSLAQSSHRTRLASRGESPQIYISLTGPHQRQLALQGVAELYQPDGSGPPPSDPRHQSQRIHRQTDTVPLPEPMIRTGPNAPQNDWKSSGALGPRTWGVVIAQRSANATQGAGAEMHFRRVRGAQVAKPTPVMLLFIVVSGRIPAGLGSGMHAGSDPQEVGGFKARSRAIRPKRRSER